MDFSAENFKELSFTVVAGFLIWCMVKMIMWLLNRNKDLSDQLLKVVERNTEAVEGLKQALADRPCFARERIEQAERERRQGGEKRGDRG